jgi:prolyl-tRNA synthetase
MTRRASSGRSASPPSRSASSTSSRATRTVDAACESLYAQLDAAGLEPFYDDRDERAGAKFATMDLIGLPYQIVIGPRGLANGEIEVKTRAGGTRETMTLEAAIEMISTLLRQADTV